MTSSMPDPCVRLGDTFGRMFVLLLALFGSAPAYAACADPPRPGVDWSGTDCEKRRLVLRGENLKNARLAGADMGRSDFSKAQLNGADMARANLDYTRFIEADLNDGAKLVQVNAYRANFSGAKRK